VRALRMESTRRSGCDFRSEIALGIGDHVSVVYWLDIGRAIIGLSRPNRILIQIGETDLNPNEGTSSKPLRCLRLDRVCQLGYYR
jgi:hypothetical protein